MTFRQFLHFGYNGERATIEDWNDHLTTLFPETRIKRYIEIRSVDSQPPELMPALSALTKGVFYDADCLQAAWDLVKGWTWDERMEIYLDSHRECAGGALPPLYAFRSRQGARSRSPGRACAGRNRSTITAMTKRFILNPLKDAPVPGQMSGRCSAGKMGGRAASGHQEADRLQRLQAAVNFVDDALVIQLLSSAPRARYPPRR